MFVFKYKMLPIYIFLSNADSFNYFIIEWSGENII
jgi:hypothetical protein